MLESNLDASGPEKHLARITLAFASLGRASSDKKPGALL